MTTDVRRLDAIRASRSEVENHYVDELVAGRLTRQEFLRRGAVLGMSTTVMGAILSACGGANSSPSASASSAAPKRGGTLRFATAVPTGAINPLTIPDLGGLTLLATAGDFLILDNSITRTLQPMLATSWSHNGDGSVWTFKLRPGVTFHNGAPLTADDVVYTFRQQADPKNATNALSSFTGVLSPGGVRKVDSHTVAFHLDAPNGNFPYLVSSDNYNMIIVPAGTDFSKWHTTFMATGPFTIKSYMQNQSATFVANPNYWGGKPYLDGVSFTFYTGQPPQILALEGGQVDVIGNFTPSGAQAILNNSSYNIVRFKSSNHRELSMRTDQAPFTDARVRRAVALTLNRPGLVKGLLLGNGSVGNDSPFAPSYPSTNTSVPQRTQNLQMAKQLLAAAGHPNGFTTRLFTEVYQEVPSLAQAIKAEALKVGININLQIENQSQYYGKATFGNSDWLDGTMSLVDYSARGAPNVLLQAPLTTHGPWNAARFHNPAYDKLVAQYTAAIDLQSQRRVAGEIERLLLEQTPLIIPYFFDGLTATSSKVHGVLPVASEAVFLNKAYISA